MSDKKPTGKLSIRKIFLRALELSSAAEREAYLNKACSGDAKLLGKIQSLLDHHRDDDFLEAPSIQVTAAATKTVDAPKEPSLGVVGRYKLLQKIGEGGYGTVYMAEQEEPVRRRVALKVIKLGMDTKEVIARFEAERQALAMMDHPNIARVLDAGATDAGRLYFVMELVRGIRITDYCNQNHLNLDQRLDLFIKVSQAIQHAHQKGIIHRDIKPSNILVTLHDGVPVPKVIDFGIAKATEQKLTDKTLFTQFEAFIGTPAYTSPEQAEMSGLDIDTRTDIYALGVLLYELLTGKTPFDGKELIHSGLEAMRRTIREEEPPRPSTRVSTLDGEELTALAKHQGIEVSRLKHVLVGDLDWIVMKCLEKDRTRRYETANGLAADLQRYRNDELVEARPPSRVYRMQKFVRRHKVGLGVAVGLGMVLVGATVLSTILMLRAVRAEEQVSLRLAEVKAERDAKEKALAEAETISGFMSEVFQSPDPGRDGRTIKVVEALDKAAFKLENELEEQPGRRAKLQVALGQTYHALGLYAEAIELLEKSHTYFNSSPEPNHPLGLKGQRLLGVAYHQQGRRQEALEMRQKLLPVFQQVLGPEDPETIQLMADLAWSFFKNSDFPQAVNLFEEMVVLSEKVNGPEHPVTLKAKQRQCAVSEVTNKQPLPALQKREELLPLFQKVFGPKHPDTLNLMFDIGVSYRWTKQFEKALDISKPALALSLEVLGPEHRATLDQSVLVAGIQLDLGMPEDALEILQKVDAVYRRVVDSNSMHRLWAMCKLASAYQVSGRLEEAKALMLEVGNIHNASPTKEYAFMVIMAQTHQSLDQYSFSIPLLEGLLETTQTHRTGTLAQELNLVVSIGSQYADWAWQERHTNAALALVHARQAEKKLREARIVIESKEGSGLGYGQKMKIRLGFAVMMVASLDPALSPSDREARFEEAEALLLQAMEELSATDPIPEPYRRECMERLVGLYEQWEKPEQHAQWEEQLALLTTNKLDSEKGTDPGPLL